MLTPQNIHQQQVMPKKANGLTNAAMLVADGDRRVPGLVQPKWFVTAFHNPVQKCEISSSHGGEYDVQNSLLGYTAV
jgi:hypothetical protein